MTIDASMPTTAPSTAEVDAFVNAFLTQLRSNRGVTLEGASANDLYYALAETVRGRLTDNWLTTYTTQLQRKDKFVAYLSAEFLMGPQLRNALLSGGLEDVARGAMTRLGLNLDEISDFEIEPGLGNGGLGRLAACFIDSLATLQIPAFGYGIRYERGIFRQAFVDGRQVEQPDNWLVDGSPWEIAQPDRAVEINFGGSVEHTEDGKAIWHPNLTVSAVPYTYPVPGFGGANVNGLRLWAARALDPFNLEAFNEGNYEESFKAKTLAENISQVLYPEDSTPQGKELRLQQQYFFSAASLRDLLDAVDVSNEEIHTLADRVVFQLNDTHPVIAIPELMRLLVDERGIDWDTAWAVTQKVFNYTCHTLLPEALEVWSVDLVGSLLPRHLEIIYRINEEFLSTLREKGVDNDTISRMSIIQEEPYRAVRMANLATVGSSKVNGVAALHSELLRDKVLNDFSALWPEKFTNVTNGVTPRRFLRLSNPGLSDLLDEAIGTGWVKDLSQLSKLEPLADDAAFRERFRQVKAANKKRLARALAKRDGVEINPDSLVDVMVKRLHEYKRQLLKLLHVVYIYDQVVSGAVDPATLKPRTVIFGAKAAPGYKFAKEVIALINSVANVVNNTPELKGVLSVAFPANYNVKFAEVLIPAADLSEQISLAGKEASGTGNMKFQMNGALTIGTLDGANVEIYELVGKDNFFLFGMDEPQVAALEAAGYTSRDFYENSPALKAVVDRIASGAFSNGDPNTFATVVDDMLNSDRFMVLADFDAYIDAQAKVDAYYGDQEAWTRSAIINVARSGFFTSDRSIQDYLDRVWHAKPSPIN